MATRDPGGLLLPMRTIKPFPTRLCTGTRSDAAKVPLPCCSWTREAPGAPLSKCHTDTVQLGPGTPRAGSHTDMPVSVAGRRPPRLSHLIVAPQPPSTSANWKPPPAAGCSASTDALKSCRSHPAMPSPRTTPPAGNRLCPRPAARPRLKSRRPPTGRPSANHSHLPPPIFGRGNT